MALFNGRKGCKHGRPEGCSCKEVVGCLRDGSSCKADECIANQQDYDDRLTILQRQMERKEDEALSSLADDAKHAQQRIRKLFKRS